MKAKLALSGLRSVFESTLVELYAVEIAQHDILEEVLPHIENQELRSLLASHEEKTRVHIDKISNLLSSLGIDVPGQKSKTILAFYKEVEDAMSNYEQGLPRDLKMASSLRKVEHFEVGAYGTARIFAAHLDEHLARTTLDFIWKEEIEADKGLEKFINDNSKAV